MSKEGVTYIFRKPKIKVENDDKSQTRKEKDKENDEFTEEEERIEDIANPTRGQIILYTNHGQYPYINEKRSSENTSSHKKEK